MAINKYLSSVLSVMPAVQARQISDLLKDLQVKGTVRNATEYSDKLKELSALVNSDSPVPSFTQIRALVWSLCSSDAHNAMMQSLVNDLEAAFLQLDEIGTKLDDHHELLLKNMMSDLERNLDSQENHIRQLEWLANQSNEFSQVLVNSFKSSSSMRVPRSSDIADIVYFDNRTHEQKSTSELPSGYISERGQKLLLDTTTNPVVLPVSVALLTDNNSYETTISVDVENPISNIIDGQRGTFWYRNIYLGDKVPKVTTVLEFSLGAGTDVDYLIVEGATEEPFVIENVVGISPDGYRISLDATRNEVNGKTRIDFNKYLLKAVQITFAVYTYHKADYWVSKYSETNEITNPDNRFNRIKRRDVMAPIIRDALSSDGLAKVCNVPDIKDTQINTYRYTFALDNVWFGNSLYSDTGIFASTPLKVKNIGSLAVRVDEKLESATIHNTIEYEIIKIDRFPKYKETKFSIPILNQTSVSSERLIFIRQEGSSSVKNVARLRFCPYIPNDFINPLTQGIPVTVYKNGVALTLGNDWRYAISSSSLVNGTLEWKDSLVDANTFADFALSPPSLWIKILNLDINAIYTVDYNLRTSDYNINYAGDNEAETVWLDKDQTVYLNNKGHVYFKQEDPDVTIESEIYLQVTLRRNTADQATSPELYEYAVLAASYN